MKSSFCLKVAFRELKNNKKIFCIYWVILFLLLTVTIVILEAERVIPDMIAKPVRSMEADRIIFEINAPSDLKEIFGETPFTVYECSLSSYQLTQEDLSLSRQSDGSDFYGEFLLDKSQPDRCSFREVKEHMTEETIIEDGRDNIFLSERFCRAYDLKCGDTLAFRISDKEISQVYIAGIYSEFTNCRSFYLSENVYDSYHAQIKNAKLQVVIAPVEFRDIFNMLSALNKNKISYFYSDRAVNALSVLYILFTALVIVLLITLFSILNNLLQTYYQKRKRFYAVNFALGLNNKAFMKVFGSIAETVVLLAFIPANGTAYILINLMDRFMGELFDISAGGIFISIFTLLTAFVTVQADVLFVLIKFFKKNNTLDIVSVIREN